jgi:alpha-L-rhamnosidase
METGLWNFEAKASYIHFLRMMLDAQRPNGAVPCIIPCTPKFGFGWGSGPAWDALLFEIPWQIYRFYGDDSLARESYGAMKRYLAFMLGKIEADGLVEYGLGDWCAPGRRTTVPVRLTDSAYLYQFCRRLSFWARRFSEPDCAARCDRDAAAIREAFNRAYYKGDGVYAAGETTSLAAPLYFEGLAADGAEKRIAERLVEAVRANGHKASFGILGAKWVPRMLAKYGYIDDAWKLFVQKETPGWMHWLESGDGTLYENWESDQSHNHVMFADYSAWAYEYVAGIVPVAPGFAKVVLRPNFPEGVESFSASYQTKYGKITASWKRENGKPVFTYSLPEGVELATEGESSYPR